MIFRFSTLLMMLLFTPPPLLSQELQVSLGSGQEQISVDGQSLPSFNRHHYNLTYLIQRKSFLSSFSFQQSWEAPSNRTNGYAGCVFELVHNWNISRKKDGSARIGVHHGLDFFEMHPKNYGNTLFNTVLIFPLGAHIYLSQSLFELLTAELNLELPLATMIMSNTFFSYDFFPDVPLIRNPLQGRVSAMIAYLFSSNHQIFIKFSLSKLETELVRVRKTGFSFSGGWAIGRNKGNEQK